MPPVSPLVGALLLLAGTHAAAVVDHHHLGAANRWMPPRTGLQIVDGPAAFDAALAYPCEYDAAQNCSGMEHSEALFGLPKYGSSVQAYAYEVPATAGDGYASQVKRYSAIWTLQTVLHDAP